MKIGFLGFGSMAQALFLGAKSQSVFSLADTFFSRRTPSCPDFESQFDIKQVSLSELSTADFLILAIKPQQLPSVSLTLSPLLSESTCVISLLAGTSLQHLESALGLLPIVRAMPNTAVRYGKGMTGLSYNSRITPSQREFVHRLFSAVGKFVDIEDTQMDALTALSGSGPAFLLAIADAMFSFARTHGFSQDVALTLLSQTFSGTGALLSESHCSISELIRSITSPQGTTAAGNAVFHDSEIGFHFKSVLEAAFQRSKELSKTT